MTRIVIGGSALVDDYLAALETNGVGEIPALECNDILWHQRAAFEAAADPAERLYKAVVALLDWSPGSEQGCVF
ncbi:MAG: hypothetical protein ABWY64_22815 [Tardiphaga sp.]